MSTDESEWRQAVPGKLINSNEVHVWRVLIDSTTVQIENLKEILSSDELVKAGRFHFEKDQKRFIAARGILRRILGHYLDMNPHDIRFEYTSHGKPLLAGISGNDTISFNLTHSGAFALYAITRGKDIGIDIERVRDDVDMYQITQRFFSQGEINSLKQIDENKRLELFFQYWTRKEAFLKAMGEGITFPMEQCDVSLVNGRVLSPVTLLGINRENSCWHVQDLFPGRVYTAAIAVEGGDWDISCWHYSL